MRAFLAWGLVLGACFAPQYKEGAPCGPGGVCPSPLRCSANNTCVSSDPGVDAGGMPLDDGGGCAPGYVSNGTACVDIDECEAGMADCSADGLCTNAPGTFSCACKPGFAGDGRTCTRVCNKVLIYDDCTGTDADCASIAEAMFADNAATGLGLQVLYGGVADEPAFRTLFDAGGFELVIIESSLSSLDPATASRVATWIDGGGRAIVSFWDLDNAGTGSSIRTAAGVTTVGEITTPRDVYADPGSQVDLFDRVETVPSPLTFTHLMLDDGDELALGGTGFIAARHTSTTGPGAIAVTRADRVITLGFLPVGLVFQGPRDADTDGKPDVQELYANLIGYLCGY